MRKKNKWLLFISSFILLFFIGIFVWSKLTMIIQPFPSGGDWEDYNFNTLWSVNKNGSNLKQLIPDYWTGWYPHYNMAVSLDNKIALNTKEGFKVFDR